VAAGENVLLVGDSAGNGLSGHGPEGIHTALGPREQAAGARHLPTMPPAGARIPADGSSDSYPRVFRAKKNPAAGCFDSFSGTTWCSMSCWALPRWRAAARLIFFHRLRGVSRRHSSSGGPADHRYADELRHHRIGGDQGHAPSLGFVQRSIGPKGGRRGIQSKAPGGFRRQRKRPAIRRRRSWRWRRRPAGPRRKSELAEPPLDRDSPRTDGRASTKIRICRTCDQWREPRVAQSIRCAIPPDEDMGCRGARFTRQGAAETGASIAGSGASKSSANMGQSRGPWPGVRAAAGGGKNGRAWPFGTPFLVMTIFPRPRRPARQGAESLVLGGRRD